MQIKSFSAGVLVPLALALTSSLAVADHPRILIDCGGITGNAGNGVTTASPATYSPYANVYWNNFTNSAVGGVITNLVTTNNVATTIGVTNTASWSGVNGPVNGGLWSGNGVSPSASLLGDFALETATEDYFFVNTAIIPQFKVVGLASTNTYRLSFFGSRTDSVAARYTTNSVVSGNVTNIVIMKTSGPGIGSNGTYSGNDSNIVSTAWITPDSNNQLTDTITYSGSGGHMNILAIMVNQPPVANNDTFSRDVGSPITINTSSLLANDTDPDGDALVFVSFSSLPAGVTTNATSITLPGTNTTQTFNYSITDGNGLTNTATVTVIMKPIQLGIQSMSTTALASNLFVVQPVIKILDALGNLVSTSAVVTVTASSGTVQGTTSVTASGGLATFSSLSLTNTGLITLTFSSPGLTSTNAIVYVYTNTSLTHQKILIDLGNNSSYRGTNVSNPDINGHYWNSVWSGVYYANLIDLANNSTPIGFGFDSAGGTDFFNGPSGATQDPNACVINAVALGNLGINAAVYDYYTSSSFELNGLNSSQNFSLTFFGSHKFNTDNVTRYGIYTDNTYSTLVASVDLTVGVGSAHNSNTVATLTGLVPQTNSTLYVKFFGTTTASSGYLNCMQISVNHPPVANNDRFQRAAGTPITISKASLMANDSDPDGDLPLFVSYSSTNGAVTSDANNIYLPANNSAETFTYSITDGNGLTNTATVTVNIIGAITNVIEVYGSSVAQGWNAGGSFTNGSYANGYAGLLTSYLGANGWFVTNNSTPGYNTSNGLASFQANVVSVAPNYIILAFGLNNEGLAGSSNPAGTVSTFLTNLTNLVSQCRSNGFYPVLGSCYPDTNYTASEYGFLKSANLTINSWNVPSYNLLGALDDGSGHYIANYNFDSIHPNTAGHQELYYSFVPTLYNAIASGKTNGPYLASATNFARLTLNTSVAAPITFTPSNTLHSFTISFRVRSTNSGTIAAIRTGANYATLQITNGQIVYVSTNGNQIVSSINATNGDWHDVALAYRYALTNTWLFVDGVQAGALTEQYVPDQFTLGGPSASGRPATPVVVDFQNWCVYRSAWNLVEAQAQMQGNRQQASMEICAALDDTSFTSNSPASNRAQSLSVAMVNSASFTALSSVTPPSNLAALSLSGTAAKLTWAKNSTTESGFELERRVTGTTNWSDVVLLPAGSISYTNSGLTAGVSYDYRVAAVEGGLRGNYSGIATVVPGIGVHQTILVDFGPNDGSNGVVTASPDYLGQYWNNFVGAGGGGGLSAISLTNLITTGAVSTSIGLNSSASGWGANGILNGGLQTPSYALLGNFAVSNATEDYFTTTTAGSFIITNLDSTLNYRLRLFGTRDTTITRVTRFIATGGNGSFTNDLTTSGTGIGNGGGNGNNSNIASLSGITPDGSKQIQLGVNALTGGFGYLGIMEIAANHSPVVQAISFSTTVGQTLSIDVVNGTNAPTDADGDGFSVTSVSGALLGGGTAATNGGTGFTYTATAAGTNQFSYSVTDLYGGTGTNTVTVVVAKATPVMQTAPTAGVITYGQSLLSSIVTGALFTNVAGATVTMASTSFVLPGVVPNAGTTNVQVYFVPTDAADYNNVTNTVNVTVNPAPLGITANNTNKVYDGVAFAGGNGVTYYGFVNGDTSVSLGGTLNYGGSSQNATHTGGYTIIPSGQTSANYAISFTNGTLTISQAATFVGASSTQNPSGYKDTVAYIATLPADATGSMVFSSTNGAFSTNTVSGVTTMSLSITNLPRGTNVITVAYLGDGNYIGSTNSLNQVVTNHPPIAAVMTVTRTAGLALIISLSDIATNWSDVDGDAVALTGVTMQSTNGVNLAALNWATNLDGSIVTTNAYAYLGYTNSPNVADQISYTIADGFGGTNTGYINIVINNSVTGTNSIVGITTGSTNVVKAYGIPGFNYILERATNLAPAVWIDISTNSAGTNGVINGTDAFTDLGGTPPSAAYYRLKWQP